MPQRHGEALSAHVTRCEAYIQDIEADIDITT